MALMMLLCLLAVKVETDFVLGQSLSRLKTVTMSSQYSDWVGSRAVDGNYDRKSSVCNCCAATSIDRHLVDQWMEIDLGETTEFNRIVVYGQNSGIFPRQNLIGLAIHIDGSETIIASIEDTGQSYVNFYHFDLGQKYSARRVKLILKGSDKVLILCEVDVFNDYIISNGKNVTAISTFGDWSPSLAADSDNRTNADACLCCAATDYHTDPWINVDLGDVYLITYIQMYGRTDKQSEGQSFEGMKVTVDNVVIQTVPTTGTFISYYEVYPTPEKIGRNVKFTLTGNSRLIIMCEVVIYGGRVISNRKPAQISSLFNEWAASRAVDGDYRTLPAVCDCCTATNNQANPWLRVDLGFEYRVTRVVIYGRTDGQYSGQNFAGMTIALDSTVVHTIPTSTNWIHFYDYPPATVRLATSVTLTLVGLNRQLIVCELLVYGGCTDGRYGYNCSETCGKCRDGEKCNFETGLCTQCEDGYKYSDRLCKTVCNDGSYGTNCRNTCGNCRDGELCDKVNGHCTECEDGYIETDKTCKTHTGCDPGLYGRNCGLLCGSCKDDAACNHVSGSCDDCMNGTFVFSDKLCNKACEPHTFGYNCTGLCGNCRNDAPCNTVNGNCVECEDGYTNADSQCNSKCPSGTFGQNCQHTCGMCACGEICDGRTGNCPNGCSNGYLGETCVQRISQDEATDTTVSLPVFIGSLISAIITTMAIMLTIMFWKLKRIKAASSKREETNEARGPAPSTQSEAASNYDSLQLSNIQSESDYTELQ